MGQIPQIHHVREMNRYFPITNMLIEIEVDEFHQLIIHIAEHPNFDLQLISGNKNLSVQGGINPTTQPKIIKFLKKLLYQLRTRNKGIKSTKEIPRAVRYLVAGHLAEIFFYRREMLKRFLYTLRHFQIYFTSEAFHQDGGVSGGCYNPSRQCVQLVMSRLFEGFNGETPGVCPFLHELGHMLDFFDAGTGSIGRSEGLYPGLSPNDKYLYNSRARDLFIKGKRLELDRYLARQHGDLTQPLPIGHPYVFQNDGEFLAGYLEMFFRNPHYFAEQNIDLFNAYIELFGYDTRKAWKEDFPHYVNANRKFYLSGQKPPKTKLTIPT